MPQVRIIDAKDLPLEHIGKTADTGQPVYEVSALTADIRLSLKANGYIHKAEIQVRGKDGKVETTSGWMKGHG
ncbi:hypothetical protein [Marinobacterium jannaschii]|uniref:hypothetical protein n=1 Tax=Marinobacterium jannaschii TaxID=64970 RepID=UPI0004834AC8|nr:hypothetical protein [Marinobacterium jannaschii]